MTGIPRPVSFHYDEQGPVATLRLDRPEALNALTFEVYRELTGTFRALAGRPSVRAVVITGTGRAFCTGGDVREIIGDLVHRDSRGLLEFTTLTCDLIRAMRALPRPIVASLNGTVAGAGAAIALASDLRVAADTAKIAFLFVKVGLAGADMGAAYLLPRLVGLGRATELLMTGAFIDAAEAGRIGLYDRVVPPDHLAAETAALVDALVRGPAEGLAETKRALDTEMHMTLEEALVQEARIQAELMARPDFREGFEAFMARRGPRFQGAPE
ncbi:MAG TPA: enoyl-CoA hydratase family protein [Vicinamibacteria bacterium]|nr:enoyl-CoA hydratase family protein [Vicinamibacteria bacterium]